MQLIRSSLLGISSFSLQLEVIFVFSIIFLGHGFLLCWLFGTDGFISRFGTCCHRLRRHRLLLCLIWGFSFCRSGPVSLSVIFRAVSTSFRRLALFFCRSWGLSGGFGSIRDRFERYVEPYWKFWDSWSRWFLLLVHWCLHVHSTLEGLYCNIVRI